LAWSGFALFADPLFCLGNRARRFTLEGHRWHKQSASIVLNPIFCLFHIDELAELGYQHVNDAKPDLLEGYHR
jgi:hypothetical protein